MIYVKDLTDIEVEGIDYTDFPDFCGARIVSAFYRDRELTDDELDALHNDDSLGVYEVIAQAANDQMADLSDRLRMGD